MKAVQELHEIRWQEKDDAKALFSVLGYEWRYSGELPSGVFVCIEYDFGGVWGQRLQGVLGVAVKFTDRNYRTVRRSVKAKNGCIDLAKLRQKIAEVEALKLADDDAKQKALSSEQQRLSQIAQYRAKIDRLNLPDYCKPSASGVRVDVVVSPEVAREIVDLINKGE